MMNDLADNDGEPPGGDREETIAQRFKDGDESVMEDIFHEYHWRVTGMLRNKFYSLVDWADDILTDAAADAWENREKYDCQRPFRPWFMAIAHNVAIDRLREKQGRGHVDLEEADLPDATAGDRVGYKQVHMMDAYREYKKIIGSFRGTNIVIMEEWMGRDGDGEWARQAADKTGLTEVNVRRRQARLRTIVRARMLKAGYDSA